MKYSRWRWSWNYPFKFRWGSFEGPEGFRYHGFFLGYLHVWRYPKLV